MEVVSREAKEDREETQKKDNYCKFIFCSFVAYVSGFGFCIIKARKREREMERGQSLFHCNNNNNSNHFSFLKHHRAFAVVVVVKKKAIINSNL